MSDVEKFYYAVAAKFEVTRRWEELHPIDQQQFCVAISIILGVVNNDSPNR